MMATANESLSAKFCNRVLKFFTKLFQLSEWSCSILLCGYSFDLYRNNKLFSAFNACYVVQNVGEVLALTWLLVHGPQFYLKPSPSLSYS